jgi:hypothetical protein
MTDEEFQEERRRLKVHWDAGDTAARAWVAQATPKEIDRYRDACDGEEPKHQAFFGGEPVQRLFAASFYNTVDALAKGPVLLAIEAAALDASIDARIAEDDAELIELEAEMAGLLRPWIEARFHPQDWLTPLNVIALFYVRRAHAQGLGWRTLLLGLRSPCRILDIDTPELS